MKYVPLVVYFILLMCEVGRTIKTQVYTNKMAYGDLLVVLIMLLAIAINLFYTLE